MFINRVKELAFLQQVHDRPLPGPGSLILMYGRRRVGKTSLLLHWAQSVSSEVTYWVAERESPALQRRKLFAKLLKMPVEHAPIFDSWSQLWEAATAMIHGQKRVLIIDELPYAAEADSAMLSSLQNAWDQYLSKANIMLVLCGSHVRIMESLMYQQSPLFGRFTGQWHLKPLRFGTLRAFFPNWSIEDRVRVYGMVGGVPAYLLWLDADLSLVDNIYRVMLSPGSMFGAEPVFLMSDEVREPRNYLSILEAIASGHHQVTEIAKATLMDKTHLSAYLQRLQELRVVIRRVPATLTGAMRRKSRQGRYHLGDPYFRFFFRFMATNPNDMTFDRDNVFARIKNRLDAFIGATAFEELAMHWVARACRDRVIPMVPETLGGYWDRQVQVDVVAVDTSRKAVLIGECKWGKEKTGLQVIEKLVTRTGPKLVSELEGEGWLIHYVIFTRMGLTRNALAELKRHGGIVVDLKRLDSDLAEPQFVQG